MCVVDAQLKKALEPGTNKPPPKCNALILCVPSHDLRSLQVMRFGSASIRAKVINAILKADTRSALRELHILLSDSSHPARSLVGSLLEPLFAAALRNGGLFRIRSLRTAAAARPAGAPVPAAATDSTPPATRGKRARVVKKAPPPPSPPPTFRYLYLNPQAGKLNATLHETFDAPHRQVSQTVLSVEPEDRDIFYAVSEVTDCPSGRILTSESKINAAFDAMWKALSAEQRHLLFQFTVSLSHKITKHGLEVVLKVLDANVVFFFFVVPNQSLFESMQVQPYKVRNQCIHGNTMQCQPCALHDTRVEQFALLCEIPGWEEFVYENCALGDAGGEPVALYDLDAQHDAELDEKVDDDAAGVASDTDISAMDVGTDVSGVSSVQAASATAVVPSTPVLAASGTMDASSSAVSMDLNS